MDLLCDVNVRGTTVVVATHDLALLERYQKRTVRLERGPDGLRRGRAIKAGAADGSRMSALAKAAYFWRSAWQGMRHAPFVHVVAIVTLAIALFTAGPGPVGGARSWTRLLARFGGEVRADRLSDRRASPGGPEEVARLAPRAAGGGGAAW